MADIKKNYELLKKKYNLPDFDRLNNEFEISLIEHEEFLLRDIVKKITEKVEIYAKLAESWLQPDTNSIAAMHECKFIEEIEKEKIYDIFKRLMVLDRESIKASLGDEKEEAEFVKLSFEEWIKVKQDLRPIVAKIRTTWDKDSDVREDLGYLG